MNQEINKWESPGIIKKNYNNNVPAHYVRMPIMSTVGKVQCGRRMVTGHTVYISVRVHYNVHMDPCTVCIRATTKSLDISAGQNYSTKPFRLDLVKATPNCVLAWCGYQCKRWCTATPKMPSYTILYVFAPTPTPKPLCFRRDYSCNDGSSIMFREIEFDKSTLCKNTPMLFNTPMCTV